MSACSEVRLDLPWYVNGTLGAAEQTHIGLHLERCAACRGELELERRIAAATRVADARVVPVAARSWQAFERALDLADATRSLERGLDRERPDGVVMRPVAMRRRVSPVAVAVAVQIVAVVALGSALVLRDDPAPAHVYRTLTTPGDTPAHGAPRLQIVVVYGTSVAAVRELAAQAGAVVEGPPRGEIFLLRAATRDASLDAIADRLRGDARVRLVEPVEAAGPGS